MRCKLDADSEGIFTLGGGIISGLLALGSVTFHAIMLQYVIPTLFTAFPISGSSVQQIAQAERQVEERMINEFAGYLEYPSLSEFPAYQAFAFRNNPAFRGLPFARGPYQGG